MPSRRTESKGVERARRRHLARRLEILRAAGREFQLQGFCETGMRDIAEAAALSPANLYNYFRGKQEILFFCQDSALERMISALEEAHRLGGSVAAKLRFVIVSHVRCMLDEVEGSAAHLLPAALPPLMQKRLIAKRDRYEDGVRDLIARGARSGEFVACNPAIVTRALLGALNWSVRWFSPKGSLTATQIAQEFADYLIRGLSLHCAAQARAPKGKRRATSADVYGNSRKASALTERGFSGSRK